MVVLKKVVDMGTNRYKLGTCLFSKIHTLLNQKGISQLFTSQYKILIEKIDKKISEINQLMLKVFFICFLVYLMLKCISILELSPRNFWVMGTDGLKLQEMRF